MNERQKRLIEVYEHLRKYYGIHTKTGFAEALHYGRTSMSAAMNGDEKYLTDSLFKNICEAYKGVFDLNYLLTGEGQLLTVKEEVNNEDTENMVNPTHLEIPDFIQKLFDEAVRMQTRNELLERQCEQMIAELRDSKDKNEYFLAELHKSKEFNDTLAAELKISRTQNEHLITELRETRKENSSLASQLETAIEGIETMKNQLAMMIGVPKPSAFPMTVNDDDGSIQFVIRDVIGHDGKSKKRTEDQFYALVPQGFIRGGRPGVTDEIVKQAVEAFKKKK